MLCAWRTLFSPSATRFRSIWSSSSLRSIRTSTVGLSAPAALNSRSAALIIVNVLPLPCVCQTSPRRASGFGSAPRHRAAARVVDAYARLGVHDQGHHLGDLGRGEVLAGGLAAAALGELADEVLVTAADDVGFHVLQAQPLLADLLDQVRE